MERLVRGRKKGNNEIRCDICCDKLVMSARGMALRSASSTSPRSIIAIIRATWRAYRIPMSWDNRVRANARARARLIFSESQLFFFGLDEARPFCVATPALAGLRLDAP